MNEVEYSEGVNKKQMIFKLLTSFQVDNMSYFIVLKPNKFMLPFIITSISPGGWAGNTLYFHSDKIYRKSLCLTKFLLSFRNGFTDGLLKDTLFTF